MAAVETLTKPAPQPKPPRFLTGPGAALIERGNKRVEQRKLERAVILRAAVEKILQGGELDDAELDDVEDAGITAEQLVAAVETVRQVRDLESRVGPHTDAEFEARLTAKGDERFRLLDELSAAESRVSHCKGRAEGLLQEIQHERARRTWEKTDLIDLKAKHTDLFPKG